MYSYCNIHGSTRSTKIRIREIFIQIRKTFTNVHKHHVVPAARISLTLSRHFSLLFIASGRSSGLHPVSSHSCCMYLRAGCPAFAWPVRGSIEYITDEFVLASLAVSCVSGSSTWTLTKRLKKKLDGNYTRMLRAILNKSWRQHPTRHQLYDHLPPITKTIQVINIGIRKTLETFIYLFEF